MAVANERVNQKLDGFEIEPYFLQSCPIGGLPSLHHNEIRDLTANLLTEVCHLDDDDDDDDVLTSLMSCCRTS